MYFLHISYVILFILDGEIIKEMVIKYTIIITSDGITCPNGFTHHHHTWETQWVFEKCDGVGFPSGFVVFPFLFGLKMNHPGCFIGKIDSESH